MRLRYSYFPGDLTFWIGRNFSYKNEFRIALSRMRSAGIIKKYYSKGSYNLNSNVDHNSEESFNGVMFKHIYLIGSVVILGILIAIIILCVEIFFCEYFTFNISHRSKNENEV